MLDTGMNNLAGMRSVWGHSAGLREPMLRKRGVVGIYASIIDHQAFNQAEACWALPSHTDPLTDLLQQCVVVPDQVEQSTVQDALHAVSGALAALAPDQHIDAFDISGAQQLLDQQRSNVSGATCRQKNSGQV